MRWILVCALIVSQARAEEQRLEPKSRLIQLSSPNHFRARCGDANATVYACTQFVGPKLYAQCEMSGDGWSIRPRATYTALIYVFKREYLRHEKLHERDMEQAVDAYLRVVEAQTFNSADHCAAAAQAESERFTSVMQEAARQSNDQRGCTAMKKLLPQSVRAMNLP